MRKSNVLSVAAEKERCMSALHLKHAIMFSFLSAIICYSAMLLFCCLTFIAFST